MTFSELTDRPQPDLRRGDVAICVCSPGDREALEASLAAVRTDGNAAHRLFLAGSADALATVGDLDTALAAAAPADVGLVAGATVVPAGWLDGLRAAAETDQRIGLVSALDPAARATDDAMAPRAPEQLTADATAPSARCLFIRRAALELVGPLDASLELAAALADLTERCVAHGLRHVVADQVRLAAASGGLGDPVGIRSSPAYGRSVTIDARCLGSSVTGTAVATLDLLEGLSRHTEVRVRALVVDDLGAALRERLSGLGVELLHESDAETAPASDVAHRPYQVGAPRDLMLLGRLGRRRVVTQLDTIAYRTSAYFDSDAAWQEYRELTRAALASADEVVFLSPHAAADAGSLGLVSAPRGTVIPLAITNPGISDQEIHSAVTMVPDRPYLLCLGTDFTHKNRRFALRLLEALLRDGGFDGGLVFAGPHVSTGSSAAEEAAYLRSRSRLRERIVDLGPVDDVTKRELLAHAAAVVYPTTFEGFGLIPFEAAEAGVPALFAWVTSLRDLFDEPLALLVPWDAEASARAVAAVLVPGRARDHQVAGVRAAASALTLEALARRHAAMYDAVVCRPRLPATSDGERLAELLADRGALRDDVVNYHRALSEIYQDPVSSGFVGPHAIVPEELQRAVLALSMRPQLRDRAVGLYRAVQMLGRRFR